MNTNTVNIHVKPPSIKIWFNNPKNIILSSASQENNYIQILIFTDTVCISLVSLSKDTSLDNYNPSCKQICVKRPSYLYQKNLKDTVDIAWLQSYVVMDTVRNFASLGFLHYTLSRFSHLQILTTYICQFQSFVMDTEELPFAHFNSCYHGHGRY
jgi:hypothetical protein